MSVSAMPSAAARNTHVAAICVGAVFVMTCLSFAAVPLYDAFCRVTGFGGVTQVATAAPDVILDQEITVRFDATVSRGLPWSFTPEQVSQTLQVGERGLAFYRAQNTSSRPIVGTAGFNVTPPQAGRYFNKIECFCFTEQLLKPGEAMTMPVTYFVHPSIADDPHLSELSAITLSYTFYENKDPQMDVAAAMRLD